MHTELITKAIVDSVAFAKRAHIDSPILPEDAIRFHDRTTPYVIHPIWCAMTIMTETMLEESVRLKVVSRLCGMTLSRIKLLISVR